MPERIDLANATPDAGSGRSPRGAAQRRYIQELLRRLAESEAYRATLDEAVLSGAGTVDVVLEREGRRIACVISVSSTSDDVVKNAAECLLAGFAEMFVIAAERLDVAKLRKALAAALAIEEQERVRVMTLAQFVMALGSVEPPAAKANTVRGYRVQVRYGVPPDDEAMRVRTITATVVGAMKRLKKT